MKISVVRPSLNHKEQIFLGPPQIYSSIAPMIVIHNRKRFSLANKDKSKISCQVECVNEPSCIFLDIWRKRPFSTLIIRVHCATIWLHVEWLNTFVISANRDWNWASSISTTVSSAHLPSSSWCKENGAKGDFVFGQRRYECLDRKPVYRL